MHIPTGLSELVARRGTEPADLSTAPVRIFDIDAWMVYRTDRVEWGRRREAGLGAILDWDLLDLLMSLPTMLPTPLEVLSETQRELVREAPKGVVSLTSAEVVRLVVPPVQPFMAVVPATDWTRGLAEASRFASYCRRMVIVDEPPDDPSLALSHASLYGIGVVLAQSGGLRVLVEPEAVADWEPTTAGWRFAERVYAQVSEG